MKSYYLYFLVLLLPLNLHAQDEKSLDITLKELQISTAPSVVLLGISPSELETPKSKKAFVFSLVSSFKKSDGIPDTYAFEVTPFWLLPSSKMNSLKFAGIKNKNKQNIFSEVKKSSFSFGFIRDLGLDNDIKTPSFAFSARSRILKIRTNKNKDSIIKEDSIIGNMLKDINSNWGNSLEREKIINLCNTNHLSNEKCEELLKEGKKEFKKEFFEYYKDSKDTDYYRSLLEAPPLLALDFAGGYSTFFSDNKFGNNHFGKLGLWITLNSGIDLTRKDKSDLVKKINFYGIARYLEDGTTLNVDQQFFRTKNFDFGGKAEFVYNRFSISYEYIYRVNEIENTFRSSGLLAYKVSDKVYINAAFGKNYGNKDNLISFLGLNWGLDSERKSVFVEEKNNQ